MVEFKVSKNEFFYILRTKESEDLFVFDKLDIAVNKIKNFIKNNDLDSENIEVMSLQLEKNKINAQQVSWAKIAEKLIKSE